MCGGCRVTVGGEVKFACVDGPDFDGHQVDYAELMNRNGVYREREAEVRQSHKCRIEKLGIGVFVICMLAMKSRWATPPRWP